jgi:hypothetical protein
MDLETSLVGTGQTYVVALPATPGEFAGVQAQIHADTTTDISVDFGDTPLNLSEDNVVDTHEKLYNAGSDGTVLMVRPSLTKTISGWAELSARARELSGDTKKITNVISVYESPFGTVRVVKNRRIRATDALIYSPDQWSLVVLRAWFREKLAKISDSDRWAMTGEYGLKHKNRKASAIITGIGVVNPE